MNVRKITALSMFAIAPVLAFAQGATPATPAAPAAPAAAKGAPAAPATPATPAAPAASKATPAPDKAAPAVEKAASEKKPTTKAMHSGTPKAGGSKGAAHGKKKESC